MEHYKVDNSADLPDEAQVLHDIMLALERLHAPVDLFALKRLAVRTLHSKPPQEGVRPGELHQAFRYGIPIDNEAQVLIELQAILQWIDERV
jgi:hypothetical protein